VNTPRICENNFVDYVVNRQVSFPSPMLIKSKNMGTY
jgi:hypothetical protein